jgi:anti-sigma factor RsiW
MHLTTEQLLALRDGEVAPEPGRHLLQCPECARRVQEMAALRSALCGLPALEPPAVAWEGILAEHRRRQLARRWLAWAAAAAALLVMAVTAGPLLRPTTTRSTAPLALRPADLADLMSASRELEMVLRSPSLRSPVLRPAEAARIVALEDQLALVDTQLVAVQAGPSRERELELWSDRVELLDQLVRARGRYDGGGELQNAVDL